MEIHKKLEKDKIYGIFVESILLFIKQYALDYTKIGFGIMKKSIGKIKGSS